VKVNCPNCKMVFTLMLPEHAVKQHLLVNCHNCEENFIQHQDFQKSISMDKDKIVAFIDNQDRLGMETYLVSRVQQMESEVVSKADILKLKLTLGRGGDVSEVMKKL